MDEPLSADEQAAWQELLGGAHRGCGGCFACRLSRTSMNRALEHGPDWLEDQENVAGMVEEVLTASLQDDYTDAVGSAARVIADLIHNGGPKAMELHDHLQAAIKALAISQRAAVALLNDNEQLKEQRDALIALVQAQEAFTTELMRKDKSAPTPEDYAAYSACVDATVRVVELGVELGA